LLDIEEFDVAVTAYWNEEDFQMAIESMTYQ